jgi:catechol 2,3-dioxygenase-like lactoylglutathione lyase family enzyme
MTEIIGLDHVQVAAPAGCELQARQFYGELLGLDELDKPEPLRARGGAWFKLGGQQLHIGVADPFLPARKAHPALLVRASEIESLASRLAGAGQEVTWDAGIPGVRRFFSADPWDNRIEFVAGA